MLVTRSLMLIVLTLIISSASVASARKSETGFVTRTVTIEKTVYNYKVFVPESWDEKKKWPVIMFLHGAGERGSDNEAQTQVGLGPAIRRQQAVFPFVVVMPQCARDRWWPEPDMQAVALKALDASLKEFNGDTSRVYLTGISMGGYGTWAIALNNAGRFAAFAPVCGGIRLPPRLALALGIKEPVASDDPYQSVAKAIGKIPVWVFHGAADPIVPVTESRKMVEALKAEGGNVRYSEYEGVAHNSWDKAYAETEFFSWLLSHNKNGNHKKH